MTEMKTLTINDIMYEIVDGIARESIENLDAISADEFNTLLENALANSPNITIKKDGGIIKLESADGTKYFSMSEGGYVVVNNGKIASLMSDTLQFVGVEGKITGLGAPTDDSHAANKAYVDETVRESIPSTETWTFTLEDGSTVTKQVYVG